MEKLTKLPQNVFYYHYKHDSNKDFNNYGYEVIGVALHSEERNYTVLYRPLYPNTFFGSGELRCTTARDVYGTSESWWGSGAEI